MANVNDMVLRLNPRAVRRLQEQICQSVEKLVAAYLETVPDDERAQAEQVLAGYVAWSKKRIEES